MNLFGNTAITSLERSLDRAALTHRVIAQNIANIDTPNYKAKHVAFGDEFKAALEARQTNSKHIPFRGGDEGFRVVTDRHTSMRNNGNNVDIDKEMVNLARNQINYQAYSDIMSREFNKFNIVLGGGR